MDKVGKADMRVTRGRGEIVPRDFAAAVKDIKLAILQSRARAAHASNVEALKLYFYVGGYVSKKTRTAKWGSEGLQPLADHIVNEAAPFLVEESSWLDLSAQKLEKDDN